MKVTQPLDPHQGPRYIESIQENMEGDVLDGICSLMVGKRDDYMLAGIFHLLRIVRCFAGLNGSDPEQIDHRG